MADLQGSHYFPERTLLPIYNLLEAMWMSQKATEERSVDGQEPTNLFTRMTIFAFGNNQTLHSNIKTYTVCEIWWRYYKFCYAAILTRAVFHQQWNSTGKNDLEIHLTEAQHKEDQAARQQNKLF